jgi:hypothetical protein
MFHPLSDEGKVGVDNGKGETAAAGPKLTPIIPVPDNVRPLDWQHPRGGPPVGTWQYHTAEGRLAGHAARVEYIEDGERKKDVYPVLWCRVEQNGHEYCAWRSKGIPAPRPLYRLPELLAASDAPIVVTEGEKKADMVAKLFPGYVGTTSMGGAGAARQSDWTPLAGRSVYIWPDNDDPGRKYAEDVATTLTTVGASSVRIIDVPQEWPEGWDLADQLPDGVKVDDLVELLTTAPPWFSPASQDPEPTKKRALEQQIKAEVGRLAAVSPIQRELEREHVAASLGIRVTVLDRLIKIEQGEAGIAGAEDDIRPGQGRPIDILDVEPWPAAVDGAEVLDKLTRAIRGYLILAPHQADAVALWIIFTRTFDAFDFSPKLVVCSPEKRSGKTRLVEVVERLACRPFFVSGISPAALLRVIEQYAPAILLDEIDTLMRGDAEMAEALRGMINSGFTRAGARFVKAVPIPNGGYEPRAFSTWCPMLLAGIGSLPDTVADRSIIIEMVRKRPDEKVKRLRARDGGELQDLSRQAKRWAADNLKGLKRVDPEVPQQLNDRAADAWSPLLAIADAVGGVWPDRARKAAIELSGTSGGETQREMLLNDIRDAFNASKADRLASDSLVAHLTGLEDRPWSEINHGKPITKTGLAGRLKPFKILPGSIRLDDGRTAKGYYRRAFDDVFTRYLASAPIQTVTTSQAKESAAFGENRNVTNNNVVTVQKRETPSVSAGCDVVTVQNPPSEQKRKNGADFDEPDRAPRAIGAVPLARPKRGRVTL